MADITDRWLQLSKRSKEKGEGGYIIETFVFGTNDPAPVAPKSKVQKYELPSNEVTTTKECVEVLYRDEPSKPSIQCGHYVVSSDGRINPLIVI